jgi:hypothetical protein
VNSKIYWAHFRFPILLLIFSMFWLPRVRGAEAVGPTYFRCDGANYDWVKSGTLEIGDKRFVAASRWFRYRNETVEITTDGSVGSISSILRTENVRVADTNLIERIATCFVFLASSDSNCHIVDAEYLKLYKEDIEMRHGGKIANESYKLLLSLVNPQCPIEILNVSEESRWQVSFLVICGDGKQERWLISGVNSASEFSVTEISKSKLAKNIPAVIFF